MVEWQKAHSRARAPTHTEWFLPHLKVPKIPAPPHLFMCSLHMNQGERHLQTWLFFSIMLSGAKCIRKGSSQSELFARCEIWTMGAFSPENRMVQSQQLREIREIYKNPTFIMHYNSWYYDVFVCLWHYEGYPKTVIKGWETWSLTITGFGLGKRQDDTPKSEVRVWNKIGRKKRHMILTIILGLIFFTNVWSLPCHLVYLISNSWEISPYSVGRTPIQSMVNPMHTAQPAEPHCEVPHHRAWRMLPCWSMMELLRWG